MTVSPFSNLASANTCPIAVIGIDYELVRGVESQILSDLAHRVRTESVALDLSRVERMDAAGIAALITLYCTSVEAGTDFSVISPSAHVLELLQIVGLEPILVAGSRPRGSQRSRLSHTNAKLDLAATRSAA